jgi:hypothetical protein
VGRGRRAWRGRICTRDTSGRGNLCLVREGRGRGWGKDAQTMKRNEEVVRRVLNFEMGSGSVAMSSVVVVVDGSLKMRKEGIIR